MQFHYKIKDRIKNNFGKENVRKRMKDKKRRVGKGIVTAVLAFMLSIAFFSMDTHAADTPTVTIKLYDTDGNEYTSDDSYGKNTQTVLHQPVGGSFNKNDMITGVSATLNNNTGIKGNLYYQIHCHGTGWTGLRPSGIIADGYFAEDGMMSEPNPWIEAVTFFFTGELSNYYYLNYNAYTTPVNIGDVYPGMENWNPTNVAQWEIGKPYWYQWIGIKDDTDIIGSGVVPNGYSRGNGYNFAGTWGMWLPIAGIQVEVKPYNLNLKVNPNGGIYKNSTGVTSSTVASNTEYTIENPTRDGYRFSGWSISQTPIACSSLNGNQLPENNREGSIQGNKLTTGNMNVTLTANWTANDYQIAFDGNGATEGEMENQQAIYDVPVTLHKNEFERTGYIFTGWNTTPDGTGASFADEEEVMNLTTEGHGIVTLYAQWKANAYTIHFEGNGATEGAMEDIAAVYDQDVVLPPNLFIRVTEQGESVFQGWGLDGAVYEPDFADQETVRNLTPEDEAVVTLYAIWDDCPRIEAVDRYFSLDFAQKGKITEEELLSTASATDREDGVLENRTSNQIAETGINGSLSLYGYAATDFTQMTDSGSVSMTYKAVDSIGNTVYKTVTVYITNTEPLEQTDFQYTRFINEKYYGASYEKGGLHPESIWRNNPEYKNALENALLNLKNETPVETYSITKNDNESVE